MKRSFDKDLKQLNTNILKMAAMTEEAIFRSVEALKSHDLNMARKVIDNDRKIDQLELIIEEEAIDLLALRQPMATDLRFITTGMKINAELERIADLACNVSVRVLEMAEHSAPDLEELPQLSNVARMMVKDAIDAFVNKNVELAKKVILTDPKADQLRNDAQQRIMLEISEDTQCVQGAIPLLLAVRHLERICDHATYIAEDVSYMVNAQIIKHHRSMLDQDSD